MELTREDTQKAKGVAILGMVMLHLFCRLDDLPYTPWIWIGETPLVYYLGLFGDFCVPIYCFCSGYAHYLLKEKYRGDYCKMIPKKLVGFLCNYWIVVALFTLIGALTGNGSEIPGSVSAFLGNVFLYRLSYNGAWWFVITYILLLVFSPVFIRIIDHMCPTLLLGLSGTLYTIAYLFRFKLTLDISDPVLAWLWLQLILLGTSQLAYLIGMVFRKERWISVLRKAVLCEYGSTNRNSVVQMLVLSGPLVAFVAHCVVQSLVVAPVTAVLVLVFLFCVKLPDAVDHFLLLMGKHSTNIWLVHMFFYLTLFDGFVFVAKYPLFIFVLMMALCLFVSWVIKQGTMIVSSCLKQIV